MICLNDKIHNMTGFFFPLLINSMSDHQARIKWSICISESKKNLSISCDSKTIGELVIRINRGKLLKQKELKYTFFYAEICGKMYEYFLNVIIFIINWSGLISMVNFLFLVEFPVNPHCHPVLYSFCILFVPYCCIRLTRD